MFVVRCDIYQSSYGLQPKQNMSHFNKIYLQHTLPFEIFVSQGIENNGTNLVSLLPQNHDAH